VGDQDETLVPLLTALRDLVAWLEDAHVSGMVIGGVAASLLGRLRVTRDIDALVVLDEGEGANFLAKGGCPPISTPHLRSSRICPAGLHPQP